MVSFKKAMALKTPEEIGKLSPKERKEYESQIQQEYKIKVHTLSGCCKKFEEYLEKTTDEPRNWHEKFKEIFSEYLNSKKHFSRTNSMIKDMYKKLSKAKYNWTKPEYYQNIFKFKAEKANKKGYIKRSAIDDKGVADIFNVSIPKAISGAFDRHKTLQNSQKGKLDAYSAMIVSKYLNSAQDMKNLEATNSNFKENSEKFHYNPVPLTKENRKAFENIETQYVYSTNDKIFTDGKIKKIHFVDADITVDVKDIGKKYNTRPLSKLNRWLLYKNIETQFIYSAEDPIYNDGKIKNHVICIKGKIPRYAFSYNQKLKEVTIQSGVETIGEEAFYGCTSLKEVTIPSSVIEIGKDAFSDCTSLKEVTIQSGVKEIGEEAFSRCTSLEKVTISGSVNKIGYDAFRGCTSLKEVTIPNSVTEIGYAAFKGCTSLKEVTIPNSVKKIGGEAFKGCTSLEKITIPNGVKEIGDGAFFRCTSLEEVTIPNSVKKIEYMAFAVCTSLEKITIPNGVNEIERWTFSDCRSLKEVTIPSSVIKIEKEAFSKCKSLEKITIPNSVNKIEYGVFSGCRSLKEVTIQSGVKEIGEEDFSSCTSLEKITIPNSVNKIECGVFKGCTSLKEIIFNDGVNVNLKMGENVFKNCPNLDTIKYKGNLSEVQKSMFIYKTERIINFVHIS